jgi:hypothetical protein
MRTNKLSAGFVCVLVFASFALCALKIHVETKATMLGYQLAGLKQVESNLFHRRNYEAARLTRLVSRGSLEKIIIKSEQTNSPSLVMGP